MSSSYDRNSLNVDIIMKIRKVSHPHASFHALKGEDGNPYEKFGGGELANR